MSLFLPTLHHGRCLFAYPSPENSIVLTPLHHLLSSVRYGSWLSSGPKIGVDGFCGGTGCGRGCLRGGQDGGISARTGRHLLESSFLCVCFFVPGVSATSLVVHELARCDSFSLSGFVFSCVRGTFKRLILTCVRIPG